MKLTKDMFDFEKYDYFAGSTFSGKDPVDVFQKERDWDNE